MRTVLLAVFFTVALAAPSSAARPGLIAYFTTDGHDRAGYGVEVVEPDGSPRGRITSSTFFPSDWSPDGRRLVGYRPGSALDPADIFVMDADGSNMTQLTGAPHQEVRPRFSPDGRSILFTTFDAEKNAARIDVMDAEGRQRRTLVDTPDDDYNADWAPDGRRVVFTRRVSTSGRGDLWTAAADGSALRPLVESPADETNPHWSPDGSKLVYTISTFESESPAVDPIGVTRTHRSGIWLRNGDGSDPRQLTTYEGYDSSPEWSPDGRRIVFERTRGDDLTPLGRSYSDELYTMAADGTDQRPLTALPGVEFEPTWAPAVAAVRIESGDVWVRKNRAPIVLSCFGLATTDCRGRITLRAGRARLAKGSFRVERGDEKRLNLKLTRAGRTLMRDKRVVRARAVARAAGERTVRRVTLHH